MLRDSGKARKVASAPASSIVTPRPIRARSTAAEGCASQSAMPLVARVPIGPGDWGGQADVLRRQLARRVAHRALERGLHQAHDVVVHEDA